MLQGLRMKLGRKGKLVGREVRVKVGEKEN